VTSPPASRTSAGLKWAVLAFCTILAAAGTGFEADSRSSARPNDVIVSSAPFWDANHDGVYTCEEWTRYVTGVFNDADRDGSGDLDPDEFARVRKLGSPFESTELLYFDTAPFDGRLSRAEFVHRKGAFFLRFDRNESCRVTTAEMNAVRARTEKFKGPARQR